MDQIRGFLVAERFAPGLFPTNQSSSVAAAHLHDPLGEVAGREHAELRSRFHEITDRRLHTSAARSRDREGHLVAGSEDAAQVLANLPGDFEKERIEIAHDRLPHRFVNARLDLAW